MSLTDPGFGRRGRLPHGLKLPKRRSIDPGFAGPHGMAPSRTITAKPHRPSAAKPQRMFDPFAPVTQQQVQHAGDVFGPVLSDPQIQTRASHEAHAQITPLLESIMADIGKRESAAQSNLLGASRNYVDTTRGYAPAVGQAYGQAEEAQAGTDAALAQALTGGGNELAQGLRAKLAGAGLATAPADVVAQTGQGAGNAALASGSAELGRLIGHGTAEQAFGAKLPGIAANTGASRAAQLGGQYAGELDSRTREVTSQLPSLIQAIVDSLTNRNESRRANRAGAVKDAGNQALNAAVFRKEYGIKSLTAKAAAAAAKARNRETTRSHQASERLRQKAVNVSANALGERTTHDTSTEAAARQRNTIAQQNADTSATKSERSARVAAAREKRQQKQLHNTPDVNASRSRGILVGKDGKPILKYEVKDGKRVKGSGKVVPYKPPKTKSSSGSSAAPPWVTHPKGK